MIYLLPKAIHPTIILSHINDPLWKLAGFYIISKLIFHTYNITYYSSVASWHHPFIPAVPSVKEEQFQTEEC